MVPWKRATISGSSGAGKSTLLAELHRRFSEHFRNVPSVTTRSQRPVDDPHYRHVSLRTFEAMSQRGEFLWTTEVHGFFYGAEKKELERTNQESVCSLLILTPDYVPVLTRHYPILTCALHILSPGEDILRERLEGRGESEVSWKKRLRDCQEWDRFARESGQLFYCLNNRGSVDELVHQATAILFPYGLP